MWGYDHWSWGGLVMSFGMLAIWGLVLWGVVNFVKSSSGANTPRLRPEEILRERFASGEIDEPEYRTRLNAL